MTTVAPMSDEELATIDNTPSVIWSPKLLALRERLRLAEDGLSINHIQLTQYANYIEALEQELVTERAKSGDLINAIVAFCLCPTTGVKSHMFSLIDLPLVDIKGDGKTNLKGKFK